MLLPAEIRETMLAHARSSLPNEACGLLAVDGDGCVRRAYCLANVDASPVSFTVDPDEHFASLTDAEEMGWALGGSFHSHPRTGAVPSRTDVARALEPEWVYVIVGRVERKEPEVRAWRIGGGVVTEEPISMGAACR
jgi:proteasome lid subunit RPN8/RPN11